MTVVVIGSSGGGTATLGHTDAVELLTTIDTELGRISCDDDDDESYHRISHALFTSLHQGGSKKGMDFANPNVDMATLYGVGCSPRHVTTDDSTASPSSVFSVRILYTGLLKDVNRMTRQLEQQIFSHPSSFATTTKINGIIFISMDPKDVNHISLSAAARTGIPVTGSGGSSLSTALTLFPKLNLVGNAGGSVATTTYTRAVSYCHSLSSAWNSPYSPFQPCRGVPIQSQFPNLRSILDACLPVFVGVCLTCRLLETMLTFLPTDEQTFCINKYETFVIPQKALLEHLLHHLRFHTLPAVCCVVTATVYAPRHGSIVIMAACIASAACSGSVLSGLLAGYVVAWTVCRALFACVSSGIPATSTNILVGGCVGCLIALVLTVTHIVSLLSWITEQLRSIVQLDFLEYLQNGRDITGFGFLFGCLFCYGSKVGYYHSFFLPVILLEMERGEASVWGAVDECTLVLVSAGICAANLVIHPSKCGSSSISKRGLTINLFCGDFVEAAHPFMEKSFVVNLFAYLASGVATEILYQPQNLVRGSAYLPVGLGIWLSKDNWYRSSLAAVAAFGISFVGEAIDNIFHCYFPTTEEKNVRSETLKTE